MMWKDIPPILRKRLDMGAFKKKSIVRSFETTNRSLGKEQVCCTLVLVTVCH